jgi:LmbE family N-acetylglucosaminyl deacetylase
MAVHAHPDDEATSTGGILARYAGQGIRTVLVTCTNGEMGDAPGGIKPGEPGHDEAAVVELRAQELEESCRILGITHLERLGYRDSGMVGWPSNDAPGAFWHVPVPTAAAPLAGLIERYQPQVVVTYDPNGFYGHPDHIQAHRITLAALDAAGSAARLYYPTIRRSRLAAFRERLAAAGLEPPEVDENEFGSPDEDIAVTVDCREQAAAKRDALAAHRSQQDNLFFLKFSLEDFTEMFGREDFVWGRATDRPAELEDDLFARLPGLPGLHRLPGR